MENEKKYDINNKKQRGEKAVKRKIILVGIVVILTITNFILFKNFYHSKIEEKSKEDTINIIDK